MNKFYVVWEGHQKGIYKTWAECKAQIDGYTGAKYKSFSTRDEAELALRKGFAQYYKENPPATNAAPSTGRPLRESWAVDAACSGNPGKMEYRGVNCSTGEVIFHKGVYDDGTNNIGEFLAIVHALALLKQQNSSWPIYTDSQTAMAWVRNKKAKTTLDRTSRNAVLFELIERAEKWLTENSYSTKIYKWDTEHWGEIPADFGRKG